MLLRGGGGRGEGREKGDRKGTKGAPLSQIPRSVGEIDAPIK